MDSYNKAAIGVAAATLLVIIACSATSIRRIAQRFISPQKLQYQPISERYEDEDGIATEESEASYTYQIQRVLVLVVSVIGSLDSLVLSVITTRSPRSNLEIQQWLQYISWVCIGLFGTTSSLLIKTSGILHCPGSGVVHRAAVSHSLSPVSIWCSIQYSALYCNNRPEFYLMVLSDPTKTDKCLSFLDCNTGGCSSWSGSDIQLRPSET